MQTKRKKALLVVEALRNAYPDAACSLDAQDPAQLLIATRLSAQCTDARVNQVTPALFAAFPTLRHLAEADIAQVEALVRPCGFYHAKARDIVAMAQMLLTDFGGMVPDSIEQLTRLPGVGRKTANLIMGDVYGEPAVVADTHLIRITNLLGLVTIRDALKVEMQLRKLLPPQESNDFCHRCVLHGRAVCIARRPKCVSCVLQPYCDFAQKNLKEKKS